MQFLNLLKETIIGECVEIERLGDRPAAGVATIGGSISAAPHAGTHHVRTLHDI